MHPFRVLLIRSAFFAALSLLSAASSAAEKPASATTTFYVSGLECGSCVYSVYQAITEVKGVTDVNVVQSLDGYANVSFDPGTVSEHQIAQAVSEAYPLHGKPYLATLKASLPDYAKSGNAARIQAIFERWKSIVKVEVTDTAKGEFTIHFLPLKVRTGKPGPQGWSLIRLAEEIRAPVPKGLGLAFTLLSETD